MSLSDLPTDLLHELVDNIHDPCDIKALSLVNRRLHATISPILSHLISHHSANILDYRINDILNWHSYITSTTTFTCSASFLLHLKYCNLAYIGTRRGWNRLVKSLVHSHGVPSNGTIFKPPVLPEGRYRALRGEISILVEAAQRGNIDLVRFLLDQPGIDVECWSDGHTAIQAACRYGHTDIVSLLLDHGADYNGPCSDTGRKALSWAVWGGWNDIVEILLKAGAMAEIYSPIGLQESTIHFAAKTFDTELLKLLLEYGHRPWCEDGNGDTPLMLSMRDTEDGMALEVNEEGIRTLLEYGMDPDCWDRNGVTPVHKAAKYGLMELVMLLLEYGANPVLKTRNGKLPMDLARDNGFREVAMVLENAARSKGVYITEW
jgi:ankyrin repeat protein